ncbi:GNAT family N-acetyltransferase [Pseudorhodoplanes sp.]|uniref:GNAT family N-acetyltransferase n=1 Tax=Pseudorhodoplanes sp. TaxID=1934341 RepID=UPI00391DA4B6
MPLEAVPVPAWQALAANAIEPNACYLPAWALPVARHARGRGDALALTASDRGIDHRLTGLIPVRWAWRALKLPVPLLVSWNAYAPYAVPLLDAGRPIDAAGALIDAARAAGARALLLQSVATKGTAYAAIVAAAKQRGLPLQVMRRFVRAGLDATQDADAVLNGALSAKKRKELRRQRHRLEDTGALSFVVAATPVQIESALEAFLRLEAQGWKGKRGTALVQDSGDASFIRAAVPALAAHGQSEVVRLLRNGETLAAGLILRDRGRAFFFKIAMDEREARLSPGVQLTLELTRHLCADPAIGFADSTADGEHPMIDHIWRARIEIADVFLALSPRDRQATAIRTVLAARYRAIDVVKALRRTMEKRK